MRTLIRILLVVSAAAVAGCAACPTCPGQTAGAGATASASPQYPAPPPPPTNPGAFATPPVDRPPAPAPSLPQAPPAPAPEKGKVRETFTRESEGAVITNSGNGTVFYNSPSATAPAAAHAMAAAPQAMAFPIIPGPLTDQQYLGLGRRVLGASYYLVTGKCPAPKAAAPVGFATAATGYALLPSGPPVQQYAVVPAAYQAPVQQAPQVVYHVFQPAAVEAQAQPVAVMATPQAPRKRGWFGH